MDFEREMMNLCDKLVEFLKINKIDSIGIKLDKNGYKMAINYGYAQHYEQAYIGKAK